jgi:D-sedoheptulose 7-phosphate isomerase
VLRAGLAARRRQTERMADAIDAVAAASVDLAERIAAGGRLLVFGAGSALPDARHLALEFLHPVIVGKRAVAALALDPTREPCARLGAAGDVALAIVGAEPAPETWRALADARARGLLTVVLASALEADAAVDHVLDPQASDPRLAKEGRVALYHLLWELTHVMLEESERLAPGDTGGDTAMGSLYPILGAERGDAESMGRDLRASGRAKLSTLTALRDVAVERHTSELERCGAALRGARAAGASFFAFGNGGSQTDADWIAAWLASSGEPPWQARSLAADPSVLTALANDVGFARVFARQVAAYGRPGDIALGVTTSGSSENVVAGLAEARRRGLVAVGLAGGDGGRLAQEGEADFLLVVPSDSVHRTQEVQATLAHLLDELSGGPAPQEGPPCDS